MSGADDAAAGNPPDDQDAGSGPADDAGAQPPRDGLFWSYGAEFHELDLDKLLDAVGATSDEEPDDDEEHDDEACAAAVLARRDPGAGSSRDLSAAIAEQVGAGPALAGLLSSADPDRLSDWDLPGMATAYRRLASWAQAGELAAIAQIASRTAARDTRVAVADDGRPADLPASAVDEVSLALTMAHATASWWSGLAVDLRWRLAATGAALAAGTIDVARARLISEATAPLSDELARAVEDRVLPAAGNLTTGQLRAALRRAVIAVDPRGADDRRLNSEQQAKVSLYADESGTAALVGTSLPAVQAAAAMSRITALARALKAAGGGRLDLLRAQVYLGLLLGTLPLIPPAPEAPPDPDGPADPGPAPPEPEMPRGPDQPQDGEPAGEPGDGGPGGGGSGDGQARRSTPGRPPDGLPGDGPERRGGSASGGSARGQRARPGRRASRAGPPPAGPPADPDDTWRDVPLPPEPEPPPDAPPADGPCPAPGDDGDDDERLAESPAPPWSPLPATIAQRAPVYGRPPGGRSSPSGAGPPDAPRSDRWHRDVAHRDVASDRGSGRPPPGLLDLTISWYVLTGQSTTPAELSRIGPVSAIQALPLASMAALHPGTTWRVLLTDANGVALAVERLRRRSRSAGDGHGIPAGDGRPPGVVRRVTVVMPLSTLDQVPPPEVVANSGGPGPIAGPGLRSAVWRAAIRAAARWRAAAGAGASGASAGRAGRASGECSHAGATAAYRPTAAIREYVEARDQTCRQPTCRQPARHADLDHTRPWDQGGPTCPCNLGPRCRTHHQIKQEPGWTLAQPRPGYFTLTTPAGRTYRTTPDRYFA